MCDEARAAVERSVGARVLGKEVGGGVGEVGVLGFVGSNEEGKGVVVVGSGRRGGGGHGFCCEDEGWDGERNEGEGSIRYRAEEGAKRHHGWS